MAKKRWWLLIVVVLVALCCGWWALPRHRVDMPTSGDSPEAVVRTAVAALGSRDFGTWNALKPDHFPDEHWYDLRPLRITDLTVTQVRHPGPNDVDVTTSALQGHPQVAIVDTTIGMENATPGTGPQHIGWSWYLARDSDGQPWRIIDCGQG